MRNWFFSFIAVMSAARMSILAVTALAPFVLLFATGCERAPSGPSQTVQIDGLTATITGEFRTKGSTVEIRFTDSQGQLVDVGNVTLNLSMPMPNMPMQETAAVTGSGGIYTARAKPGMAGRWFATLSYKGPQGSGQTKFEATVR